MTGRRVASVLAWVVTVLVAVPALALTASRASGSGLELAVRLAAFAPLGIVLYALLVLRFAVRVVRRPGRRRLPVVAALVAVAGLGVHLWWLGPLYLGSTPAPAAGAEVITVMNSNLFKGRGDVIDVVDQADRAKVDVLVLEEVTVSDVALMKTAGIDDLLPYHAGEPGGNANVVGTMVYSDRPLTDVTKLSMSFDSYSMKVGDGFTLVATHPVAPIDSDRWLTNLGALTDAVADLHPDLVVGDLNSTLDHRPLRHLLDVGHLADAAALANSGFQPTWPSNDLGPHRLPTAVQIDHVLLGPRYTAISTRTLDIPHTDHRALIARVALRE